MRSLRLWWANLLSTFLRPSGRKWLYPTALVLTPLLTADGPTLIHHSLIPNVGSRLVQVSIPQPFICAQVAGSRYTVWLLLLRHQEVSRRQDPRKRRPSSLQNRTMGSEDTKGDDLQDGCRTSIPVFHCKHEISPYLKEGELITSTLCLFSKGKTQWPRTIIFQKTNLIVN